MDDDGEGISAKTWTRAVDPIIKAGYMNGASDGQSSTFQSSFDMGYEEGLSFGMELGVREAILSATHHGDRSLELNLADQRKINCQICINSTTAQGNIANLYNTQKNKNDEYSELTKSGRNRYDCT